MAGCVRFLLGMSSYCFLACIGLNFLKSLCSKWSWAQSIKPKKIDSESKVMFSGVCICLVISENCSSYIDTSSRHITLPVMLPSNLTASKWALSHGIIAAWFITSANYWCQINQASYKMKWQNKLYLEEFSESCVLLQLLAKTATSKSWLKILVAWHWLNWTSGVYDRLDARILYIMVNFLL